MNKKKLFVSLLALAVVIPFAGRAVAAHVSTWTVDPVHSSANFTAVHLGLARVNGVIPIVKASLEIPDGTTVPTHVEATLDPKGIDTHNDMRNGDLRSSHFFDTDQFPAMSFQSTSFIPSDDKHFVMNGNLTMHGQTHAVALNVEYFGQAPGMHNSQHIGYEAKLTVDKTLWGMNQIPAMVVGNSIDLTIDIDAIKESSAPLRRP